MDMGRLAIVKNRIYSDYFMPSRLDEYENIIKNLSEAGCFFYLAVHKADDLGRKDGYLAPINYMRTTGMENLKVDCSKYDLNAMIKQVSKQVLENEKQTH